MLRAVTFISLLLLALVSVADARKWEVNPVKDEPSSVYIRHTNQGYDSFQQAVDAVPQGAQIKNIFLGRLIQVPEPSIQREILAYFQQHHPEELKAALASSGNLHNPKVEALRGGFDDALLRTSFVKGLNKDLKAKCFVVKDVSFEKFFMVEEGGVPGFDAMVWLRVGRCGGE